MRGIWSVPTPVGCSRVRSRVTCRSSSGRAARAAPDGYTISIGYWGTHVANAAIYVLDYDVVKDFEPISLLVESPLLIAASKATPAREVREVPKHKIAAR